MTTPTFTATLKESGIATFSTAALFTSIQVAEQTSISLELRDELNRLIATELKGFAAEEGLEVSRPMVELLKNPQSALAAYRLAAVKLGARLSRVVHYWIQTHHFPTVVVLVQVDEKVVKTIEDHLVKKEMEIQSKETETSVATALAQSGASNSEDKTMPPTIFDGIIQTSTPVGAETPSVLTPDTGKTLETAPASKDDVPGSSDTPSLPPTSPKDWKSSRAKSSYRSAPESKPTEG